MRSTRSVLLVTTTLIALLLSGLVWAQEETDNSIQAQPLTKALAEFAEQTGMQLVYPSELTAGLDSSGASAEGTPDEILNQLLASTGLEYEYVNDRTIAIALVSDTTDQRGASDPKNLQSNAVLMAQNHTNQATETIASRSNNENREIRQTTSEDSRETRGQIETIVVVGSRNAGIRRYEDDAQPYVTFDSAEIERSFAPNLEEFLKTRLPMNAAQTTISQSPNNLFGNQSSVDLRGLGSDQTLILVNGRRMPSVGTSDTFEQPDINGIPMSAIERIEVLPTTAAGIYGGGATGGAINIVLKRDYVGFELNIGYDNTFDTDSAQRKVEGSAGFSLEGGRSRVFMSAAYSDANPLLVGDRDFARYGRRLQLSNNSAAFLGASFPPAGYTTNIQSRDGSNLVLLGGTDLGSPITFIPIGYSGVQSDNGQALINNSGEFNLDLPDGLTGAQQNLLSNPRTSSFSISASRDFTDWLEISLDGSFYENDGRNSVSGGVSGRTTIRAGSPNNPFTSDIRVSYPHPGLTLPSSSKSTTTQASLAAAFQMPEDWTGQLEFGKSRSRLEASDFNRAVSRDFFIDVFTGDLDVMRDLNAFEIDFAPYLATEPTRRTGPIDTTLENVSARLSGPIMSTSAGQVILSMLAERREEEREGTFTDDTDRFGEAFIEYFPPRKQVVDSLYAEALIPLRGQGVRVSKLAPGSVELQIAGRYDQYDTTSQSNFDDSLILVESRDRPLPVVASQTASVSSLDYTVGLRFAPTSDVLLRASYGTGFLPPSIFEIVPSVRTSDTTGLFLEDPKRGGLAGTNTLPIELTTAGNPSLDPEESESLSVGLILTPSSVPGLRMSLDYTRIRKTDEIAGALNETNILDFEDQLPDRVTRAPLTPEDAALGYTAGEIVALNLSAINVSATDVEAFDLQLDFDWTSTIGDFRAFLVGTRLTTLENNLLPGSPTIDRVGYADGPLDFRGNAGLTLQTDRWMFGWNVQYYDSYRVFNSTASDSVIEQAVLDQGSSQIPSQTYHDLFLGWEFGGSPIIGQFFDSAELRIGVLNVFDKSPPTVATTSTFGGYSFYGDPRLRRYSVTLTGTF